MKGNRKYTRLKSGAYSVLLFLMILAIVVSVVVILAGMAWVVFILAETFGVLAGFLITVALLLVFVFVLGFVFFD
jgi:hypothetical protein